ncbi:MAG TPA: hypothetical protein VFX98_01765 [Longimicrobiaceae bacterium]|nr:hypothetical protein [Longimicrobiaceae bacterium]
MANGWQLAGHPEVIEAFCGGGRILFFVLGEKPTPCHEVRIVQGPEDIWPPIYNLEWRQVERCPEVVTGYCLITCLEIGKCPDKVTVRDEDGSHSVPVREVSPNVMKAACEECAEGGQS